jgi:Domain of unknown function (DUF6983)
MSQLVALTNNPNQSIVLELTVDGKPLSMYATIYYNEMAGYWLLDLFTTPGVPLLLSTPLITGVWPAANMLGQYAYLSIGGLYILNVTGAQDDYPDDTELGTQFAVYWTDTPPL